METVKKVLTDAYILKPKVFQDERGGFFESFNKGVFDSLTGTNISFVQDNQSNSSKGTLRGLHFQCGKAAQSKLVRVVKGSVYDVAVDLRPQSPTFKQWHAVELNEHNHLQFFIPRGFANAFLALEDETIFQYKVDNFYSRNPLTYIGLHERGLNNTEIEIVTPYRSEYTNIPMSSNQYI